MMRPRITDLLAMLGIVVACTRCALIPTLCVPRSGTVGFFSKGDCAFTNAASFRGHEWLTYLGNRDLPAGDRFTEEEADAIVEGNRRVDWPKELLVHMGNSIVSYIEAANELQDRPEAQPVHFLLDETNTSAEAVVASTSVLRSRVKAVVASWVSDRPKALAELGASCHTVQDSFSQAHAVREVENPARPWCVRLVKAYLERADGFEVPKDQIHGGTDGDTIGHTTTQDSIYRVGRDCNDPTTTEEVEQCLSVEATRARFATSAFLLVVRKLVDARASEADVDAAVDAFIATHMSLCP